MMRITFSALTATAVCFDKWVDVDIDSILFPMLQHGLGYVHEYLMDASQTVVVRFDSHLVLCYMLILLIHSDQSWSGVGGQIVEYTFQ